MVGINCFWLQGLSRINDIYYLQGKRTLVICQISYIMRETLEIGVEKVELLVFCGKHSTKGTSDDNGPDW